MDERDRVAARLPSRPSGLSADDLDAGLRADVLEEAPHHGCRDRNAAFRRREAGLRKVKEDRAAAPPDHGATIAADIDDDVVKMVVAPHALVPGRVGQGHGLVIAPVVGIIAPTVPGPNRRQRKPGPRP